MHSVKIGVKVLILGECIWVLKTTSDMYHKTTGYNETQIYIYVPQNQEMKEYISNIEKLKPTIPPSETATYRGEALCDTYGEVNRRLWQIWIIN